MLQVLDDKVVNYALWEVEGSSKARIVQATPDIDTACGYIARVSSKNQDNASVSKLLRYCLRAGHWSVVEQGYLTIEIVTPLAIAIQVLRHRSATFQQFSGRYADQTAMKEMTDKLPVVDGMFYIPEQAREQDTKNRQNSIVSSDPSLTDKMWKEMDTAYHVALNSYNNLLDMGIAKEIARFVLPEGVYTRMYMSGTPRTFLHYINVRDDEGVAQWEHVELARAIKRVFAKECPIIAEAMWGND